MPGRVNRVNVKHIIRDTQGISVGAFITARLNSRNYWGLVKKLARVVSATEGETKEKGRRERKKDYRRYRRENV